MGADAENLFKKATMGPPVKVRILTKEDGETWLSMREPPDFAAFRALPRLTPLKGVVVEVVPPCWAHITLQPPKGGFAVRGWLRTDVTEDDVGKLVNVRVLSARNGLLMLTTQ
eukprot:TRINITY_DN10339_c0_g1_i1.p1 TRINITY_DN10339_c0_g1~~TRINITY_DN10339_c0_g1_i1.p1  ORF type:complete len:113 (-),score=16.01 TRINITY_DN10339_c0_g1_i1:6-344(-)